VSNSKYLLHEIDRDTQPTQYFSSVINSTVKSDARQNEKKYTTFNKENDQHQSKNQYTAN